MTRIVAIDGPAGAGKSTVARKLAERLGFVLLDTGALYRAVALAARRAGIAWDDELNLTVLADELSQDEELTLHAGGRVLLRGEDVSAAIRQPDVSVGASLVSSFEGVRAALLTLQRTVADARDGVVAEGRDMGTVVFPDAPVKFFLTASLDVRARRRNEELRGRGHPEDISRTRDEVEARDRQDSQRPVAPLRQADDALLVDSSGRDVEAIVDELVEIVKARL